MSTGGRHRAFAAAVGGLTLAVLAGCGSPAPSAATPSNGASATASPAPGRSASPAPSKPAPTSDPGQAALRAFVAFASDPGASYQATFTGHSRHTTDILPISDGLHQVSGRDVRVRATFTFPDKVKYAVEHRYVDGKAWIKRATEPWQRLTAFTAATSMAAFPAVRGVADVTYLGPTKAGGRTLYRVQLASAIVNPVMIPATNLSDVAVTSPRLVVLVDAAGTPVSGTAEIGGRGRVSGQLQEIVIDLALTFTKVGQPVSISAP